MIRCKQTAKHFTHAEFRRAVGLWGQGNGAIASCGLRLSCLRGQP